VACSLKDALSGKNNCGKYPRPTANFTVWMQSSKQLSSEKYQSTLEECDGGDLPNRQGFTVFGI
jgi:hypothetical protein